MKKFLSTKRVSSRRFLATKHIRLVLLVGVVALALYYLVPRLLFLISAIFLLPVVTVQSWLTHSTGALPEYIRDRSELIEEIATLRDSLQEKSEETQQLEFLEKENKSLRELLGENEEERIMAGVIARPNQLPYDVLLLDQGSADGIEINTPVYIGAKTVIGYISKTTAHSSIVTLVTTPGFVSTVFVYGPDIYTNAIGQGGGQMRIGVPQGVALSVGDIVVLPSVSSGFYGAVTHVESRATEPEQYGYVTPAISLQGLHYVSVGKKPLTMTDYKTAKENVEVYYSDLFTVPVPEDVLVTLGESDSTSSSTEITATTSDSDLDSE